jgi:cyclic beta-1,2-glucan synthetase
VVAADVYSNPRHVGRGGWTWYSGSAGWMQRAGIESILGLLLQGGMLHLDPCIPTAWPRFSITLRHRSACYEIEVENPDGAGTGIASAALDDAPIEARPLRVALADDGKTHRLRIRLG